MIKQSKVTMGGKNSVSFDFDTTYYPHAFFFIIGETDNGYRTGTLLINNRSATGGAIGGCTFYCERKSDYVSTIYITANENSNWAEFIILYN